MSFVHHPIASLLLTRVVFPADLYVCPSCTEKTGLRTVSEYTSLHLLDVASVHVISDKHVIFRFIISRVSLSSCCGPSFLDASSDTVFLSESCLESSLSDHRCPLYAVCCVCNQLPATAVLRYMYIFERKAKIMLHEPKRRFLPVFPHSFSRY